MIEEFNRQRDGDVYEGFTLGGKNYRSKRTYELNFKNVENQLYDSWVETIEESL